MVLAWVVVSVATLIITPLIPAVMPLWQRVIIGSAISAQLLPVLAVGALERPVPRARYWIAIWAMIFFVSDLTQLLITSVTRESNLWYFLIANPIEDAALLMAFSYWQLRPVLRLTFRLAIPLLAIATLAIALAFGEVNTFKANSSPFRLLLITAAVAHTLVARTAVEQERIWDRDWLWTSLGVLLYYAANVVVDPVSAMIYPQSASLAVLVYVIKAVFDLLAYIMVWKGMRCPVEAPRQADPLAT